MIYHLSSNIRQTHLSPLSAGVIGVCPLCLAKAGSYRVGASYCSRDEER